jgi:hypothetical protein
MLIAQALQRKTAYDPEVIGQVTVITCTFPLWRARAAFGRSAQGIADQRLGKDFAAAYNDQLMLTDGIDKATARTEVQHTLGLSRWVREAEMYSIAKKLFPDQVIMREASPAWLGRQRLDVLIPALNLALEHQGQQHYSPVTAFGGDEALKRGLERDAIKRCYGP